jgi:hypothetical protein
VAQVQLLKPYPRILNVAAYRNNSGTTNYHAGEIKVEEQLMHGLSVLFSYTHSKLIDDASSVFPSTVLFSPNSSSLIAADTYNPRLERDLSSGDMPNVLLASITYELPVGKGHAFATTGISRYIFSNWTANAVLLSQSGMPVTVTQSTNNNSFAGFALQRPNVSGTTSLSAEKRTPAKYFNTGAFSSAPQFTLGSASRNPVRGPAYRDLDLALVKRLNASHHTNIEFRGEIFDLMNTPAFAQPSGSFGSTAFGSTITDPRVVRFAVRIRR